MKIIALCFGAMLLTSCATIDAVQILANAGKGSGPQSSAASASDQNSDAQAVSGNSLSKDAWAQYAHTAPSSKTYPKSGKASEFGTSSVNVGQWAVYRHLKNNKVESILKIAIVGKDADALIFEFASYESDRASVVQEAVKGLETVVQTGNSADAKLVWLKVMDNDGKVTKIDGSMLGAGGAEYTRMLSVNAAQYSGAVKAGGSVTVPAGTFAETWKIASQVQGGKKKAAHGAGWVSTVVPLWHLIKSVSDDGSDVLELAAFGTSGYRSAMPQ